MDKFQSVSNLTDAEVSTVGIGNPHELGRLAERDHHLVQGPAVALVCPLRLLGDECLSEHFLELGLVVKLLNLNELHLSLGVLVLEHLLGWVLGLRLRRLRVSLLIDWATGALPTLRTEFTVLLSILVHLIEALYWHVQSTGRPCLMLLLRRSRIAAQSHTSR